MTENEVMVMFILIKKKMMIEMEGNEIQCYYNPFLFELVK